MNTIKSRREFEQVFSEGKRYNSRLVRICVLKGGEGDAGKVAFVAAKRLGNAVVRNRCKRVLREAARICDVPREQSSVILFATPQTRNVHPQELARVLAELLQRAGI